MAGTVNLGLSPTFQQRHLIYPLADKEREWLNKRALQVSLINMGDGVQALCLWIKYSDIEENYHTIVDFLSMDPEDQRPDSTNTNPATPTDPYDPYNITSVYHPITNTNP